jgi:membrane protease YdiL (CAAX protease family)
MRIDNSVRWFWVPAVVLILILGIWCHRRRGDTPSDLIGTISGIGIESVAFALGLWGLSRLLGPLMQSLGVRLALSTEGDPTLRQLVPYLGAGIYEEVVFRLLLYSLMFWLMRRVNVAESMSTFLAAVGSATLFSAAHHVGPNGDPYGNYVFLFRLVAGLYFALIFHFRGFGIAVGTHACYNVMVSVGVP